MCTFICTYVYTYTHTYARKNADHFKRKKISLSSLSILIREQVVRTVTRVLVRLMVDPCIDDKECKGGQCNVEMGDPENVYRKAFLVRVRESKDKADKRKKGNPVPAKECQGHKTQGTLKSCRSCRVIGYAAVQCLPF